MLGDFFGRHDRNGQRPQGPVHDPYSLSPFGGAHDPFAGMMNGFFQQQQQMQGGAGGSCCFSSCCYSSSSGPNGHTVQYSSTTTGGRQGNAPMVSETQQQYWDSTGHEKLGVARRIGERGRSIVAERLPDGEEKKVQTLMHLEEDEASRFDHEWQEEAHRLNVPRAAQVAADFRPALTHDGARRAPTSSRPAITGPQRESARRRGEQKQLPGLRLAPGHH